MSVHALSSRLQRLGLPSDPAQVIGAKVLVTYGFPASDDTPVGYAHDPEKTQRQILTLVTGVDGTVGLCKRVRMTIAHGIAWDESRIRYLEWAPAGNIGEAEDPSTWQWAWHIIVQPQLDGDPVSYPVTDFQILGDK